ncbi:hypothetical protein CL628_01815 [bacterium]|nr:hypothetical protein [bacterium]
MHLSRRFSNTDRVLQIGQIGHGRWGKNIAQTLIEDIGGVHVRIATTPAQTKRLLKEPLDAVIIATPGSTHAKIALPFIKRGIPTYIEKPLATSLSDAKQLQQAAKNSGASIFVGHIHLYNPAYLKAKELAAKAGRIHTLYLEGMNNGPIRDDMSALWDWSPHDVSMAIDLLGKQPTKVQAWGHKVLRPRTDLYDMVHLKLSFGKAATAYITNGWLSARKFRWANFIGTKDTIIFDDLADKKVALYKGVGPRVTGAKATERQPTISYPRYSNKSPLEIELRAFLRSVKAGEQPATDIKHAMQVMTILDAAERSMKLDGKLITI